MPTTLSTSLKERNEKIILRLYSRPEIQRNDAASWHYGAHILAKERCKGILQKANVLRGQEDFH